MFGGGTDLCLGIHLARMEAQIAIGTMVQRLSGMECSKTGSYGDRRSSVYWAACAFGSIEEGPHELRRIRDRRHGPDAERTPKTR